MISSSSGLRTAVYAAAVLALAMACAAEDLVSLGASETETERVVALAAMDDGGCVVALETSSWNPGHDDDGWLVRFDAAGAIAWERTIGAIDDDEVTTLLRLGDDSFLVSGDSSSIRSMTCRLSADLSALSIDPGLGGARVADGDMLPDGSAWLLVDDRLLRRDPLGNISPAADLRLAQVPPCQSIESRHVVAMPDGGAFVVLARDALGEIDPACVGLGPASEVYRFGRDGSLSWSFDDPWLRWERAGAALDGRVLLLRNSVATLIDAAGTPVQDLRFVLDGVDAQVSSAATHPSGGWVVAGIVAPTVERPLAWLAWLQADLGIAWAWVIDVPGASTSISALDVGSGGMTWASAHLTRSGPDGDAAMVRVQPDGSVATTCGVRSGSLVATPSAPTIFESSLRSPRPATFTAPFHGGLPGLRRTGSIAEPACRDCAPDPHEWDDTCGFVDRPLRHGEPIQHRSFCDDADDWTFVHGTVGTTFVFETGALGSSADTVLELWSSDCMTMLAADDDGAGGRASRLAFTATEDGPLHVRVRQADGSTGSGREYELGASRDTPACRQWAFTRRESLGIVQGLTPLVDGGHLRTHQNALIRSSAAGTIQWQVDVPDFRLDGSTVELRDGSLVALSQITFSAVSRPALVRFSPDGGAIRARTFSTSSSCFNLVARSDGGISATMLVADALGRRWVWLDLDANLDVVAARDFPLSPVLALADGGFLAASRGVLARLFPDGAVMWARTYGTVTPTSFPVEFYDFTALSDGGFLAVGADARTGSEFLVRLAADGTVTWVRTPAVSGLAGWQFLLQGMAARADGGAVVTAAPGHGEEPLTTWLWTVAPDGTLVSGEGIDWKIVPRITWMPDGDALLAATDCAPHVDLRGYGGGDWTGTWTAKFDPFVGLASGCSGARALPELTLDGGVVMSGPTTLSSSPTTVGVQDVAVSATRIERGVTETCTCSGPGLAPRAVSGPGSWHPLRVHAGGLLTWEPGIYNGATAFNVYRGPLWGLRGRVQAACLIRDAPGATAVDGEPVDPAGWYYLVTGVNAFGQGPAGNDSLGAPRLFDAEWP